MVKVHRPDGDLDVYARMHPYPHSDLSYVDIFTGSESHGTLIVRTAPLVNDVAEAIIKALNATPRGRNAAPKRD